MRTTTFFILFSFLSFGCITDKTCSDHDKTCNISELLISSAIDPGGIYLYSTQQYYQGNLAAYGSNLQSSLTNICYEARFFAQTISNCSNVLPFASSDTTSISAYETDFSLNGALPVRGARGELLFDTWTDVFVENPKLTMSTAGVISEKFWTFTISGGLYQPSTSCTNGVNSDNGDVGAAGDPNSTALIWYGATNDACNNYRKVLCICY
ncbi:hypothetical protein [Leptospira koniambonensis]|uniref:hypothetical protein n=1 Tax=Leptospira koniambonensis TaxID=2484950 RepID=UPI003EBE376D